MFDIVRFTRFAVSYTGSAELQKRIWFLVKK